MLAIFGSIYINLRAHRMCDPISPGTIGSRIGTQTKLANFVSPFVFARKELIEQKSRFSRNQNYRVDQPSKLWVVSTNGNPFRMFFSKVKDRTFDRRKNSYHFKDFSFKR